MNNDWSFKWYIVWWDEQRTEVVMFFQCAFIVFNFKYIFNDNEDEGNDQFVDLAMGV